MDEGRRDPRLRLYSDGRPCDTTISWKGALGVLPTDVVNAADRGPVSDRAVWSLPVVVVEPVWQRQVALSMRAVGEAVCPLAGHRLVEALNLAVGARPVGLGGQVPDPSAGEQLAQGAVLDVAEAVVSHQPLRDDPVLCEEGQRPVDEAGHGRCFLVLVELDVGEPGVIVDDRVRVVVADPRLHAPTAQGLGSIAGDPMAGPQEAGVAAGVHVQEITRARPLIAVGRLPGRPRRPRDPGPAEHLPDGRVREASRAGDQARSPTRLAAAGADRLLELRRELTRRAAGTARTINQARQRPPRLIPGLEPAVPPAMRRRRRNAECGRGRIQRQATLDGLYQRETASQSELGVTVKQHPRPPLSVSPGRPTASKEGRIEPLQPFTTCIGTTSSHGEPLVPPWAPSSTARCIEQWVAAAGA